jgi:hypothetical protein
MTGPQLKTSIIIKPDTSFNFVCRTDARLLYSERSSNEDRTEILPVGKKLPVSTFETIIVVPAGQLDVAFANGWRLPTELKVEVLSYNLLIHNDWIRPTSDGPNGKDFVHGSELRHHLALGDDFALATQIFYEKNTVSMSGRHQPPRRVRRFVRNVIVTPDLPKRLKTDNWAFLQRLNERSFGFTGLGHITIRLQPLHVLCGVDKCNITPEYLPENEIKFSCRGTVSTCPRQFYDESYDRRDAHANCQDINAHLQSLVTFTE